MKNPQVSIIIPTYNHCDDFLKPCIESIIKHTTLSRIEIIVIANGCTDNTMDYLLSLPQDYDITVIWIKEPNGFTNSVNRGLQLFRGDYALILNNDVVILDFWEKDKWLDVLIQPMIDSDVGITGPVKIYDGEINYAFIVFCVALIAKRVVKDIGLLNEIFSPGYGEDIEYCYRAENAGYRVLQVPKDNNYEYSTDYPIYHKAEGTVHDEDTEWEKLSAKEKSWIEIVNRNKEHLKTIFKLKK